MADTDCDDRDPEVWQDLPYRFRDADGDGHTVAASGTICSGASPPPGYSTTPGEPDCDDADPAAFTVVTGFHDADGDGFGEGAEMAFCTAGSLPAGFAATLIYPWNDHSRILWPDRIGRGSPASWEDEVAQYAICRFHAFGEGHRRNDSKINFSSVTSVPCAAATAAATAACAIAGFHPSPVSAAFACVRRIAASSRLAAPTWARASMIGTPSLAASMWPAAFAIEVARLATPLQVLVLETGIVSSVAPTWAPELETEVVVAASLTWESTVKLAPAAPTWAHASVAGAIAFATFV